MSDARIGVIIALAPLASAWTLLINTLCRRYFRKHPTGAEHQTADLAYQQKAHEVLAAFKVEDWVPRVYQVEERVTQLEVAERVAREMGQGRHSSSAGGAGNGDAGSRLD